MSPLPPTEGAWALPQGLRASLVRDHPVRPAIYWLDLLASAGFGWLSFVWSFGQPHFTSFGYWIGTVVSAFAFLRAAYFMHELAHRSSRELPLFHLAWNLLVGIPILVPSLMIWPHRDHHALQNYGTDRDPEYAPVARWGRRRLIGALSIYAIVPWLMAIRWGFTAPFSHLHPRLRRHALEKFSTADIYHAYARPPIPPEERSTFLLQETACMVFVWAGLGLTVWGILPWTIHLHRAIVMTLALLANHGRALIIHGYDSDGSPRSGRAQVLDSVTLGPRSVWTELVAPVGSRFHALHHELPSIPYHALPAVHRRVVAELPPDAPYFQTVQPGFWSAWARLWRLAANRTEEGASPRPG